MGCEIACCGEVGRHWTRYGHYHERVCAVTATEARGAAPYAGCVWTFSGRRLERNSPSARNSNIDGDAGEARHEIDRLEVLGE
jgi:hypothetical protein